MIQVVTNYKHYVENIKEHIDNSPYKTSFFMEKLGVSKQTFYRKIREKSFTVQEVDKLTKMLFPEETLEMLLEQSENDIKNGKTYSHKEAMAILRKEYIT